MRVAHLIINQKVDQNKRSTNLWSQDILKDKLWEVSLRSKPRKVQQGIWKQRIVDYVLLKSIDFY